MGTGCNIFRTKVGSVTWDGCPRLGVQQPSPCCGRLCRNARMVDLQRFEGLTPWQRRTLSHNYSKSWTT
eukprot:1109078-Amphidinium_carterae.1